MLSTWLARRAEYWRQLVNRRTPPNGPILTQPVMQRTVIEGFYRRKFVLTLKADRNVVVGLTDVSQYVLVEKTKKYVDAKYHCGSGVKQRVKKRDRFSRRAD